MSRLIFDVDGRSVELWSWGRTAQKLRRWRTPDGHFVVVRERTKSTTRRIPRICVYERPMPKGDFSHVWNERGLCFTLREAAIWIDRLLDLKAREVLVAAAAVPATVADQGVP